MRRRLLKILITLAGLLVLAVLGLVLYLSFGDLSGYRGLVEDAVSEALGRDFSIAGAFKPSISLTTRLVAEDVSLANVEWSTETAMVRAERISLTLDLWSLISGPIHLRDIEIRGARVLLEKNEDGRANWEFQIAHAGTRQPTQDPPVVIGNALVERLTIHYREPSREPPLEVVIERLELEHAETDMLVLIGRGRVQGTPVECKGRIGPYERLLQGKDVDHDLAGSVGDVEIAVEGTIAELATLAGTRASVKLKGRDIESVAAKLDLPSLGEGPFSVSADITPNSLGLDLVVDATLGKVSADIEGSVDSLLEFDAFDLTAAVSGRELAAVGSWIRVAGLPDGAFEITGRVRRDRRGFSFEALRARVGENALALDGALGAPPRRVGTDVTFHARGPDLSEFRELSGIELPAGSFEVEGHLVREESGIRVAALQARIGEVSLRAEGIVGEPPAFSGTELALEASGPHLAVFNRITGVELPADPYTVEGRVAYAGESLVFSPLDVWVGEDKLHAEGKLTLRSGLPASDLRLSLQGPDLSRLAAQFGVDGLPREAYSAQGRVNVQQRGYLLDAVQLRSGDLEVQLDGRSGPLPELEGTDLHIEARGPDLSLLGAYAELPALPAEPFTVAGRIAVDADTYRLDRIAAQLGSHRISVDGTLNRSTGLRGSATDAELTGPNLADAGRIAAEFGLVGIPPLPTDDYSISAKLRVTDTIYEIDMLTARVGETELELEGLLSDAPEWVGSDLTVQASGPDATVIGDIVGVALPADPFRVSGRVERLEEGGRFQKARATLGDYMAELHGTLGNLPSLAGTNLDVHAAGPDTALLQQLIDLPDLAPLPFEVSGHFDGQPELFSLSSLQARLGQSDLAGTIHVDLRDKPALGATLSSARVDLTELLSKDEKAKKAEPAEKPAVKKKRMRLSDEPFDFSGLQLANGEIHWTADELLLPKDHKLSELELDVELNEGHLHLGPFAGVGTHGARLTASADLAPSGQDYSIELQLALEDLKLDLSSGKRDSEEWLPVDTRLAFAGTGRSLHGIVSSGDGWLVVVVGSGPLDNTLIDDLGTGLLTNALNTINPFRSADRHTELECAVIVTTLEGGIAKLDPLAMRSDQVTVVGDGKINFTNEKLNLEWAVKPRKGAGLSASTLTNPYIKLGGTLSNPSLELKPIDAVASTGAAVVTAGLSLLARGLYNRASAGKKVCDRALAEAERRVTITSSVSRPAS